jgi:hypothetical protein
MALQKYLDSFAVSTGAAGTTQARTLWGFAPKAMIVFGSTNTSGSDNVTAGVSDCCIGFATSNSSRCVVSNAANNGVAASDTARSSRTDAVHSLTSSGGSITALLDIDSFDADGATFIVDDAYTAARIVEVLAFGGDDITQQAVGSFVASTSNATQDVTLGWQPDVVFVVGISNTTNGNVVTNHALMSFGAAVAGGAAGNAVVGLAAQDAQNPTVCKRYCRNGESVVGFSTAAAINGRGYLTFGATGFTVNWNANPSAAHAYYYLAMKGGSWALGDVLTRTDTTTDITESGLSFAPLGGLMFSACGAQSSAGTVDASYKLSFGAFTGTSSEAAMGIQNIDAVTPSQAARGAEFDASYLHISGSSLEANMNVTSLDSGGITARMGDAETSAAFVPVVLFGSNVTGSLIPLLAYLLRSRST